jgi:hypothetical protein
MHAQGPRQSRASWTLAPIQPAVSQQEVPLRLRVPLMQGVLLMKGLLSLQHQQLRRPQMRCWLPTSQPAVTTLPMATRAATQTQAQAQARLQRPPSHYRRHQH